jgi:protoheme IX farnesyltransferase
MKPELTFLSVLSALCGFYMGTRGSFGGMSFLHTAIGTMLLGGGAGALNQHIERRYDALMKRTERRPLPAGRLVPAEALAFGLVCSLAGIIELTLFTNALTGFLGALTFMTYIFLYTPLKRITPWATIVGGIPGALPPVMGWTAARNELSAEPWILFSILFCWQIPHFLSLAWMYRKDYARAGFKILTVMDHDARQTSAQIILFTVTLLPASVMTTVIGSTGILYAILAIVFGAIFLAYGIILRHFTMHGDPVASTQKVNLYARRLFYASLLYLPLLMIVMSIDKA